MNRRITITTGSRLHFGPLSYGPRRGRHFGGVGLMIDRPGVRLAVSRAERDEVGTRGDAVPPPTPPYKGGEFAWDAEEVTARVRAFVAAYRDGCPADRQPPRCRFELFDAIPSHAGLGSGTQLGLAVAKALAILANDDIETVELARRVRRGLRSALGIHGFDSGGLLVDGGKRNEAPPLTEGEPRGIEAPPDFVLPPAPPYQRGEPQGEEGERYDVGALVARVEFPDEWRIVLVTPPGRAGLSGAAERDAFRQLPTMRQATTDRLCRIVLTELLPAVLVADFESCGESLYEYGRTVGEYFAPVQGGVYANRGAAKLAETLRRQGIRGVGQTSWGPTLFVLMPDEEAAGRLRADLGHDSSRRDWRFEIARPLNRGAEVQVETAARHV